MSDQDTGKEAEPAGGEMHPDSGSTLQPAPSGQSTSSSSRTSSASGSRDWVMLDEESSGQNGGGSHDESHDQSHDQLDTTPVTQSEKNTEGTQDLNLQPSPNVDHDPEQIPAASDSIQTSATLMADSDEVSEDVTGNEPSTVNVSPEIVEHAELMGDHKADQKTEQISLNPEALEPSNSGDAVQEKTKAAGEEEEMEGGGSMPAEEDAAELAAEAEAASEEKQEEDEWTFVLGHDKLKKKTLRAGAGLGSRPNHGQVVIINSMATLEDGRQVEADERLAFVLGDGDVTQALDLCVALMELNEVAQIVTEPQYAFGKLGREPDIPGSAKLTYEVELLEVEDAPVYSSLPLTRRLEDGDKKRERGNWLYVRKSFSSAIGSYMKAVKILDNSGSSSGSEEASELQKVVDLRLKCYNNLAATQLKVEAWDQAIKSSDEVLKIQPDNVKALFRKGKCLASKGSITEAIPLLKRANALEPDTKIIHQELSRLVKVAKTQEKSEKEMYQKMFGTKNPPLASRNESSKWIVYLGGAIAAGLVGVGVAYRYLHS